MLLITYARPKPAAIEMRPMVKGTAQPTAAETGTDEVSVCADCPNPTGKLVLPGTEIGAFGSEHRGALCFGMQPSQDLPSAQLAQHGSPDSA